MKRELLGGFYFLRYFRMKRILGFASLSPEIKSYLVFHFPLERAAVEVNATRSKISFLYFLELFTITV